jgi:hypothetical protein
MSNMPDIIKCRDCLFTTYSEIDINIHRLKHHNEKATYECGRCSFVSNKYKKFIIHSKKCNSDIWNTQK